MERESETKFSIWAAEIRQSTYYSDTFWCQYCKVAITFDFTVVSGVHFQIVERVTGNPRFVPPKDNLDQLRQQAWSSHPLSDELPINLDVKRVTHLGDKEFTPQLRSSLEWMQKQNGTWAERQLETIRKAIGDWSMDGLLVNQEGRLKVDDSGSYAWSSYAAYMCDAPLPFDLDYLIKLRDQEGEWYFPLNARRDSIMVWFADFEDQVRQVLDDQLKGDVQTEDFAIRPPVAAEMPSMLRAARIVRNKLGAGKFASEGILLGGIGFWQRTERVPLGYIPRVQFQKSSALPKSLYISGLPESVIVLTGGLTMDEKYDVDVTRVDPAIAKQDFIAAAAKAAQESFGGQPFVLRYNPYRPWFGEVPTHG